MSRPAMETTYIDAKAARTLMVGRTPDNDVPIDHPLISRHHVRFQRSGDSRWTVTDLGSTNGTYVNGQRLAAVPRHLQFATEERALEYPPAGEV